MVLANLFEHSTAKTLLEHNNLIIFLLTNVNKENNVLRMNLKWQTILIKYAQNNTLYAINHT